jgi:hypothetical protein
LSMPRAWPPPRAPLNLEAILLYSDVLTASFTVKNTGAYDGNEVAQLYIVRLFTVP